MTLWKKDNSANSAPKFVTDAATGETGVQEYGTQIFFVQGNEGYPVPPGWARRTIKGSRVLWESIAAIKYLMIPINVRIVAEGDSLTAGLFATSAAQSYPSVSLPALTLGNTYNLQNIATSGIAAATINTNYASRGGASFDVTKDLNVYSLMAGTNDKSIGTSDLDIYRVLRSLLRKAKLTGYQRRLIGTMISRNDATIQFSAGTQPLNVLIRQYWDSDLDADGLFDFGISADFDLNTDANNATIYNADKLHLTDAGYAKLAAIYGSTLKAAIDYRGVIGRSYPTGWSPMDKSSNLVLSNANNKVAWSGGGFADANVRGLVGRSSGKWYWETVLNPVEYTAVGLMNEAYEGSIYNDSGNPQGSVNAMALGWSSAKLTYNGAHLLSPPALTTGAIVQHALDATTHRYWIKIDNGQWNLGAGDPALGTGGIDVSGLGTGTIYPLAYIRVGGSEILGHFIAADMAKAVPTGFAPIAG